MVGISFSDTRTNGRNQKRAMFRSAVSGMRVKEAVTCRSQGQDASVYIFSTNDCDRAKGMYLLAYASNTRGGHNRKEERSSEVMLLACHKQTRRGA